MANVELKTDFKDGEVLFGEQLNNNFKAIKAALEAANKIAWQDNLDDEIVAFKGTTEEVEHRPVINGQLVYDVEQGFAYIDIITYSEENYPTLVPQRIKLSGGGEGIATIDSGDYADIIEEGIYLIKSNKVTDKLSSMSGTISKNYNKLMYVLNSGSSARPNVKQVLMDGFDFYIRTAYLNGTSSASSATEWEKRTIGEGGTEGSSIYIGEEEPTDDSTLWIDPDNIGGIDGLLNTLFPIGKVEIFYDELDHSNHLGFTWERTSVGRFPIGAGTGTDANNDTKTVTVGQKGGAYKHTLAINEMPSHNHMQYLNGNSQNPAGNGAAYSWINSNQRYSYEGTDLAAKSGGGQPHNNIPPYEAMAFWKRIG